MSKELSVIIVNYNGMDFLGNCLNSIQEKITCDYEVIIVDNASNDNSCDFIIKNFPDVVIIKNSANLGFAAGTNLGALKAKGKILLLLNNDTILLTGINSVLDLFSSNTKIGVVGCKMYYGNGRIQYSYGYEHTPLRIFLSWVGLKRFVFLPNIFRREVIDKKYYTLLSDNVQWVSGAFLATRRSLWEKLNGLDESYFMYMEDVDYCKRALALGFKIIFNPKSEIIHFEGSDKNWIGSKALEMTVISYIKYVKKFYGYRHALIMKHGLMFVFFMRKVTYQVVSIFNKSATLKEKHIGYSNAIKALLKEE